VKFLREVLIGVLCLAVSTLAFGQATTVQRSVEGRALNLVIPDGYCLLERQRKLIQELVARNP
jgi:hypothetical protein